LPKKERTVFTRSPLQDFLHNHLRNTSFKRQKQAAYVFPIMDTSTPKSLADSASLKSAVNKFKLFMDVIARWRASNVPERGIELRDPVFCHLKMLVLNWNPSEQSIFNV